MCPYGRVQECNSIRTNVNVWFKVHWQESSIWRLEGNIWFSRYRPNVYEGQFLSTDVKKGSSQSYKPRDCHVGFGLIDRGCYCAVVCVCVCVARSWIPLWMHSSATPVYFWNVCCRIFRNFWMHLHVDVWIFRKVVTHIGSWRSVVLLWFSSEAAALKFIHIWVCCALQVQSL